MEFFNSAVDTLQTIVVGLGGALCVWGGVNLLEGYGADNPASKSQGIGRWRGPHWHDPRPAAVRAAGIILLFICKQYAAPSCCLEGAGKEGYTHD